MGGGLPERLRTAFERGGEMGRRMLALDWSATPLGAPEQWPDELRTSVATMLASKAQVIVFWGPEYCGLYNDAYIPVMGAKHPALLGRPGPEMWAETWSVLQDLFNGVIAADEAFWAPNHPFMIERYGFLEEAYFDVSYDPVRLGDGTIGGIFCIVSDTTLRVLGERRVGMLGRLGARLADSSDQAGLGARVAQVLGENAADVPFAALYLDDPDSGELTLAGCCGVPPAACWPLGDPARRVVDAVLRTGRPDTLPVAASTAQPPPEAAGEALVLPVGVGSGTVGALVVGVSRFLALDRGYRDFLDLATAQISRAVSNLRAYEQERRRSAELAALDAAKTNFFSNVSHEFRTPLTLILGPLGELLDGPGLSAVQRDILLPMRRNALRLLRLVNTVLDFSRLESGRLRAEFRPTDLAGYTRALAGAFRPAAERAGLRLVIDTPPLAAPVHLDRESWEKIVFNLLSNAVKFTREGTITVSVRPRPAPGPADGTDYPGAAVLEVADTGVGVPEAEQPLLFDRFHRVTGAWSRSHEGTGIGLALVRELAGLHGGTVEVTSTAGVGSTFTVTIPFGTEHLDPERIVAAADEIPQIEARLYVEEAHCWADGPPASSPAPSAPKGPGFSTPSSGPGVGSGAVGRRGRILLADDNADLRDYVARLLRPHWDVVAVANGRAALDRAVGEPFDLVLTDVMMPVLDGFGLIRALRADDRTADVPIVVLSARAGEESSVEGLAVGADDYLVKPFSARDLTARVRANLELGQLRRQIISRLRGLVDAAAAVSTAQTTAAVLDVAARHVQAMTTAGRVVVTAPGGRAEVDGGANAAAGPDAVLPLPDTSGAPLGELSVWSGRDGGPEPVLLTQLARLIGLRLENARLYEAEHRIAGTLQHSLLPSSLPRVPGAIIASRYLPGSTEAEVGGDWYDVIAVPGDQLFLVIGDVVGKGVQAAAAMGQLRNALRAYILEGFDCGAALTRLNSLVDNLGRTQFATVVCVRFDPRTRRLHFSSAGHPSPVRVAPGEAGTFLYEAALGPPIGALRDVSYPTLEADLPTGNRLLLYTDGLVEDRRRGIDVGLRELTVDVGKPVDHVEDLLDLLLAKAAGQVRRDDIALLALQATEPREFVLRLPAEPAKLSVLRRRLEDFLVAHEVPENDIFDLTVAVSEAAANAIEHPVDPTEPIITVEVSLADAEVLATVRDTGSWRPPGSAGFRGRGLALIGALSELVVENTEKGTVVRLSRPLSRRSP